MEQKVELDLNTRGLLDFLGFDCRDIDTRGINSLKIDVVFACIRILSSAVAKTPLKIYKDNGAIKKFSSHYLSSILQLRPNEYMSAIDFFECVETQRNLYGNAFVYIEFYKNGKERGLVKGLYPLDSTRVEIYMDSAGIYSSSNKLWYVVTLDNEQIKLRSDEILHFKHLTVDGIQGISPIKALNVSLENASAGSEYINKFYKSGMQTKGIVHYVGDLSPEAENNFRSNFERMSNGLKNAHKISLLPVGFKFEPIKATLTDSQFVENNKFTIKQIASAFGIKNHQLNDLDRATHSNIGEQQREFYVDTLMAILSKYEQEISYKLFTKSELDSGFYVWFNADVITRADIKTRYEAYRVGIQGGFLTPNEVRQKEELEEKKGGDELYVNGATVKLSSLERGEI